MCAGEVEIAYVQDLLGIPNHRFAVQTFPVGTNTYNWTVPASAEVTIK
jgi:hypothetical protein